MILTAMLELWLVWMCLEQVPLGSLLVRILPFSIGIKH